MLSHRGTSCRKPFIQTKIIKGRGSSLEKLQRNNIENKLLWRPELTGGELGFYSWDPRQSSFLHASFPAIVCSFSRGTACAKVWSGSEAVG